MSVKHNGQSNAEYKCAKDDDHQRKPGFANTLQHAGFIAKYLTVPPEKHTRQYQRKRDRQIERIIDRSFGLCRRTGTSSVGDSSIFGRKIDNVRVRCDTLIHGNIAKLCCSDCGSTISPKPQGNIYLCLLRAGFKIERNGAPSIRAKEVLGIAVGLVERVIIDGEIGSCAILHIVGLNLSAEAIDGVRQNGDGLHNTRIVCNQIAQRNIALSGVILHDAGAYAVCIVLIGIEFPSRRQRRALGVYGKIPVIEEVASRELIAIFR